MVKRLAFVLAACCAVAFPVVAQDGHEGHEHGQAQPDPAEMAAAMKMMQPGEHHEHIGFYEGTWKTQIKNAMTGEETEGTYTYSWSLGNRMMVGSYSGTMMGMPFEGMSIDGYDNLKGEYFSIWMDTMGTGFTLFTGAHDGENSVTYTGTGTDPMSGGDIEYRSVSTRTSDDSFSFVMYMTQGGQEMKLMEMNGTRM